MPSADLCMFSYRGRDGSIIWGKGFISHLYLKFIELDAVLSAGKLALTGFQCDIQLVRKDRPGIDVVIVVFGLGNVLGYRLYVGVVNGGNAVGRVYYGVVAADINAVVAAALAVPAVGEHSAVEVGALDHGEPFSALLYEGSHRSLPQLVCAPSRRK